MTDNLTDNLDDSRCPTILKVKSLSSLGTVASECNKSSLFSPLCLIVVCELDPFLFQSFQCQRSFFSLSGLLGYSVGQVY